MNAAEFQRLYGSSQNHPRASLPHAQPSQQAAALVGQREGKARSAGRPHVSFTLRRVRLLDVDAKFSSIKDLLDGLQYAGLVDGDREDQITLGVTQEKVDHFHQEQTVVEIQYPQN